MVPLESLPVTTSDPISHEALDMIKSTVVIITRHVELMRDVRINIGCPECPSENLSGLDTSVAPTTFAVGTLDSA